MESIVSVGSIQVASTIDVAKTAPSESTKEFEAQVNKLFVDMMMKSMSSQFSLFGESSSEVNIHKELYMNMLSDELASQLDIGAGAIEYNQNKGAR